MRDPLSSSRSSSGSRGDNRVRIIGGRWRGRKLQFPDSEGLRPTGDRIRETLFNWLMPVLPGAHCLDLFAGSGVLGFEALSRGAADCVFLERHSQVVWYLEQTKQILAAEQATILRADSLQWLATAAGIFDIVFIDPPFADKSVSPAAIVRLLQEGGLLAADPWIYIEQSAADTHALPEGFMPYRQQRAGQVSYSLWRKLENTL